MSLIQEPKAGISCSFSTSGEARMSFRRAVCPCVTEEKGPFRCRKWVCQAGTSFKHIKNKWKPKSSLAFYRREAETLTDGAADEAGQAETRLKEVKSGLNGPKWPSSTTFGLLFRSLGVPKERKKQKAKVRRTRREAEARGEKVERQEPRSIEKMRE